MGLIVIAGPPAGGKTTWARANAQPGDIIIDLDALTTALTTPGTDPYTAARHVRSVAFRARTAAIGEALRHTATCDVYVIHSSPKPEAMAGYTRLGARLVTIDPGQNVVMARCQAERPESALAVAARWYAQGGNTELMIAKTSRQW